MFDYLKDMNNEIIRVQEWIEVLRTKAESMTKCYANDRVQTSSGDSLGDIMVKIVSLEERLNGMIDEYSDAKMQAKRIIFSLHNEEWQDIVYMRCIEQKTFREISRQKGGSIEAVKQKYRRATKYIKKHLT